MINTTESEQVIGIQTYYEQSAMAYNNWGRDLERDGIYALHCGYEEPGQNIGHWDSIKQLTRQVIRSMDIQEGDVILDAGCGTGAASFETKSQYPSTTIYGINLALNQLQSARTFAEVAEVPGSFFVLQDYISTAFQSETFNKIMFIESIAHAQTKRAALQESKRILKPGGILTVADIFFQREPTTDEEREWVSDLARGWFMPNLNSIDVFKEELEDEGFEIASERNISENILPSTLRMRLNSEQRMIEEKVMETVSKEIYWSRKAVIASHKVVESGLIGYYLLNAKLK